MLVFQIVCFILGFIIVERASTHLFSIFDLIGDNIRKVDEVYDRRCLLLERIVLGKEIKESALAGLSDGSHDDAIAKNCEILLDGFFPDCHWVVVTPVQANILAQRSDKTFRIFRDGNFVKSFDMEYYNLRDLVDKISDI